MEKLCLCCGTKFSGNIDLLSGDFAATYFYIHKYYCYSLLEYCSIVIKVRSSVEVIRRSFVFFKRIAGRFFTVLP